MSEARHKTYSSEEILEMFRKVNNATVGTHEGPHIRMRQMHHAPDTNLSLYFATMKGDPKTLQFENDSDVTIQLLNQSGEMNTWSEAELSGHIEFVQNSSEINKARSMLTLRSPIVKNLVETKNDHILEWLVFKPRTIKYRVFGEIVQGIPPTILNLDESSENLFISDVRLLKKGAKVWYQATRALFLLATLLPVILGITIAFFEQSTISIPLAILTILSAISLHLGANLLNDYMDHIGGSDKANVEFTRPFSGGSRVIQLGLLSPVTILTSASFFTILGSIIGLYLAIITGLWLWIIGGVGLFIVLTYSIPKIGLASLGLGEFSMGLVFGPLMTLGAYYVQTTTLSLTPVIASIPLAGLIALVLLINEFPDIKADESVSKRNLVVKLGTLISSWIYIIISVLVFALTGLFVYLEIVPVEVLATFVAFPFLIWGWTVAKNNLNDPKSITPACAATTASHLIVGLALIGAYLSTIFGFQKVGIPSFIIVLIVCVWFYLYISKQKRAFEQAKQTF